MSGSSGDIPSGYSQRDMSSMFADATSENAEAVYVAMEAESISSLTSADTLSQQDSNSLHASLEGMSLNDYPFSGEMPVSVLQDLRHVYGSTQFGHILKMLEDIDQTKEKVKMNRLLIKKLIQSFEELNGKIEKLESGAGLVNPKSVLSAKIRTEADDAVMVLCHELLLNQSTIEAHRMQNTREKENSEKKFQDLQTKIIEKRQRMQTNGKYLWRIDKYRQTKEKTRHSVDVDNQSIISPHFQTPSGHEFRLRAFLNGTGKGKGTHLSMFIQMYKTEFDDILEYPFNAVVIFKVLDQCDKPEKKHHKLMFRTNNSPCFQRPKPEQEFTPENGLAQLLSHDVLEKRDLTESEGPVYIKNDVLFVGADIVPPS